MRYSALSLLAALTLLSACGDKFDINTVRGRQAAIDEANLDLSNGNCQGALDAITPLFTSVYVTDDVRVVAASAHACFAGFAMLPLLANITGNSSFFNALAETMFGTTVGNGRIGNLYAAVDVLTQNGAKLSAGQRSTTVNDFMVFLQMGVMGAIQAAYGNPSSAGVKGATFNYLPAAAGTLSNTDGCAYAAAVSFISDSFSNSDLSSNTAAATAVGQLNSVCLSAGTPCSSINRDRTVCDGANAQSVAADAVVDAVNASW